MDTYYTLLNIPPDASPEAIKEAYTRTRERYNAERAAELGEEFRDIAEQRLAKLERAYAVLSNPERRRSYDAARLDSATQPAKPSQQLSRRELVMAAVGILTGLLVLSAVWIVSGNTAPPTLSGVGETRRPAPEIALAQLDGKQIRLSEYRGKVVLVNFWATWCEPCKEETPALQAAYQKLHEQGLEIIGVHVRPQELGGDPNSAIPAFVSSYGVTYPIVVDSTGDTTSAYQVAPLPTSFFIDKQGMIRFVRLSMLTTTDVEVLFNTLRREETAQRQ